MFGQVAPDNSETDEFDKQIEETVDWLLSLEIIPQQNDYQFVRFQQYELPFERRQLASALYLERKRDATHIQCLAMDLTSKRIRIEEPKADVPGTGPRRTFLDLQKAQLLFRKELLDALRNEKRVAPIEVAVFLAVCKKAGNDKAYDKLVSRMPVSYTHLTLPTTPYV